MEFEARDYLSDNAAENSEGSIIDEDINMALQSKWSGMLEGVDDRWTRRCMARLYENEMVHLHRMKRRFLGESTLAQNIPDLVKFVFPVIRRVWANLIANGLFSVQPMNSPIGGIFFWKYLYGTTKGTITAGDEMIENFDRFYSSEYVDAEVIGAGPGTNFTGTMAWKPVKGYGMGQVGIEYLGTAASDGSTKRIYDADGTGTLTGDTGAASTITLATGVYDITFSENVTGVTANYFYNMEAQSDNVPQVNVQIDLEPVKAWSRKLKILWSSEAADDMRAVLNMDIEPELTSGIANEIALGIDRELIMAAYGSGTTNTDTFDAAVPPGRNQVDHFRNIMTTIEKVSGAINTRTHRGPGNFIVTGPSVQPIFGALATHGDLVRVFDNVSTPPAGQGVTGRQAFSLPQAPTGYGVYPMGFLQNKWTVIIDPYFPAGKMLVGLKGPMFTDSGLVYAPYVPLEMTSAFLDPADFTLRKGMRTRYNKKLTNSNFYGIITVTNLP
jgi:hypothetical protein